MSEIDPSERQDEAYRRRVRAAKIAQSRNHPKHACNGEEHAYRNAHSFMSFTKGLPHDPATGLVKDPNHPVKFRKAIDSGIVSEFDNNVPLGDRDSSDKLQWMFHEGADHRRWEAPTAGFVYDLEGPDAQAVTMPPAPSLVKPDAEGQTPSAGAADIDVNPELVAEMAEVYWLALLRDTPLDTLDERSKPTTSPIDDAINHLGGLDFYSEARQEKDHPRRRLLSHEPRLGRHNIFRGHTPGDRKGPYLSQFLLMGDGHLGANSTLKAEDGILQYGSISIDMRVRTASRCQDYMTHWNEWLDVQNGAHVIAKQAYEPNSADDRNLGFRFIATLRDLATYVHFDALYEAYLNACIWLLNTKAPVDPHFRTDLNSTRHTEGFALFGGPHILSLMTEVATRGLKAVRFQKFNNHLRLRPEALAGLITAQRRDALQGVANERIGKLCAALADGGLLDRVGTHNAGQNERHEAYLQGKDGIAAARDLPLLPVAFPEGSPMHPSYGAGHATVAGACVTMLKAFFDERAKLVHREGAVKAVLPDEWDPVNEQRVAFVPTDNGSKIENKGDEFLHYLSVGDELNKLAANISIARNMGGVHYYSDYIDSLRMGEKIAMGILEEQSILYPHDAFRVSLTSFDGQRFLIEKGETKPIDPDGGDYGEDVKVAAVASNAVR